MVVWRFGPDINQVINFRFLKQELRDINLVPEVGDLILFRNNFYEVDSRVEKLNLIPLRGGKYPTTTKVDGSIANPQVAGPGEAALG